MLLTRTRDLNFYTDPAHRGTWDRRGSGSERIALQGRTLLVVGLGGIGTEVARRGKGFEMNVVAVRRSDVPPPLYVDRQEKPDALMDLLPEADVVAICLPLTDETRGLFDEKCLRRVQAGVVPHQRRPRQDRRHQRAGRRAEERPPGRRVPRRHRP